MARAHVVPSEESFEIPAAAFTFEGFRRWAQSDSFPETGRIDYLAGDVDVDMSPEEISTSPLISLGAIGRLEPPPGRFSAPTTAATFPSPVRVRGDRGAHGRGGQGERPAT